MIGKNDKEKEDEDKDDDDERVDYYEKYGLVYKDLDLKKATAMWNPFLFLFRRAALTFVLVFMRFWPSL